MWLTYYICKNTHRNLSKMRWQRNMFQTKEQDKTPEEQLSEVTIGSLPERGFWVMTVKMIHKLRKRMNAQSKQLQGVLNTELENINSYQTELKNPITEMKWHCSVWSWSARSMCRMSTAWNGDPPAFAVPATEYYPQPPALAHRTWLPRTPLLLQVLGKDWWFFKQLLTKVWISKMTSTFHG